MIVLAVISFSAGSSPRVRGTELSVSLKLFLTRFIPAGAGNGWTQWESKTQKAVHPRGCGERTLGSGSAKSYAGSSPRVRGTAAR